MYGSINLLLLPPVLALIQSGTVACAVFRREPHLAHLRQPPLALSRRLALGAFASASISAAVGWGLRLRRRMPPTAADADAAGASSTCGSSVMALAPAAPTAASGAGRSTCIGAAAAAPPADLARGGGAERCTGTLVCRECMNSRCPRLKSKLYAGSSARTCSANL